MRIDKKVENVKELERLMARSRAAMERIPAGYAGLSKSMPALETVQDNPVAMVVAISNALELLEEIAADYHESITDVRKHVAATLAELED